MWHVVVAVVQSTRPRQWTKNQFIFAGILFSQNILQTAFLLRTISAFFVFCLLSGSVYIVNDLIDSGRDARHPAKSQRPLASGSLKRSEALAAVVLLAVFSFLISSQLGLRFLTVASAYFLLQIFYSLRLKDVVILDVFVVAFGFVLRVVAGGIVIGVNVSAWLIICTILLALFLALSKRRHELIVLGEEAAAHRSVLDQYSPYLLDQMISVVTASTVVTYALYTMSAETVTKFATKNLIFTIPFVIYGVFRYLYLIHRREMGGNPESVVVTDKPLMIDILLWVLGAALIIYL